MDWLVMFSFQHLSFCLKYNRKFFLSVIILTILRTFLTWAWLSGFGVSNQRPFILDRMSNSSNFFKSLSSQDFLNAKTTVLVSIL